MKKVIVLILMCLMITPISVAFASNRSVATYDKIFNMLEEIRKKDDNFETYLQCKYLEEKGLVMLEEDGIIRELRFIDLPKEEQGLFRSRYEYMTTTTVVSTTNPENWMNVFDKNEYKVVPSQVVKMSRTMVWLQEMQDAVIVLRNYEEDKEYLPTELQSSYHEFVSEIPMYMEILDSIISYTDWVTSNPESQLKAYYDPVSKLPRDWFDIRKMGEDSIRMLIHGASMIAGAYIGGEIGAAAGLTIGAPTGPGAGATTVVGATGGALAGSMLGDYVGGWIANKVAHVGGDIVLNLYDYAMNNNSVLADFLKNKLF